MVIESMAVLGTILIGRPAHISRDEWVRIGRDERISRGRRTVVVQDENHVIWCAFFVVDGSIEKEAYQKSEYDEPAGDDALKLYWGAERAGRFIEVGLD